MDGWTEGVQKILERAPARAMSFSSLVQALAAAGAAVSGREDWILRRMLEQPEAFRVIPSRLGPWALWPDQGEAGPYPGGGRGRGSDPWIMTCSPGPPGFGSEGRIFGRIQESLQAWGQNLDVGSQVSVARWIRAIQEVERSFGRLLKEGADPA